MLYLTSRGISLIEEVFADCFYVSNQSDRQKQNRNYLVSVVGEYRMNQKPPLYAVQKRPILEEAKQAIIEASKRFYAQNRDKLKELVEHEFCRLFNEGKLDFIGLTDWVKDHVKSLSRSTLHRWIKAAKLWGAEVWARVPKRQGLIDHTPELKKAMEALIAEYGYKTPRQFVTLLQATLEYSKLPLPSEGQIRRWVKKFRAENNKKEAKLRSQKEYKNLYMPAQGSYSRHLSRPNELWELDSSPTDIYLFYQDEDGSPKRKRFTLVACIDVFTRRTKIRVAETSNSEVIALLIRDCILDWGVPETLKMDNGKDYASKLIQRFCAALDVNISHCQPFHPWQKPHIERFFRTFQHGELELLPGFVGHNLSERDHLRESGRLNEKAFGVDMNQADFQQWADQWCRNYHQRNHKGLNLAPIEKLKEAVDQGWTKRTLADSKVGSALDKLDLLLLPGDERKIVKSGINFKNKTYIHPRLDLISTAFFRYNPDDVNSIYVFSDPDYTNLLCEAFWVKSITPEQQAKVAQEVKAIAKKQHSVAEANRKASRNNKRRRPADFLTDDGDVRVAVPEEVVDNQAIASMDNIWTGKPWHLLTQEERNERQQQINDAEAKRLAEEDARRAEEARKLAAIQAKEEADRKAKEERQKEKERTETLQAVAFLKKLLLCELPGGGYHFGQLRTWASVQDDRDALEDYRIQTRYRDIYNQARNELIVEGFEEGLIPPHGIQKKPFGVA